MTARLVLADPPEEPPPQPQPLPPAPHPSPPLPPAPRTARAELDELTGPLPAGAAACARWGEELAEIAARYPLLVSDRLRESREVARRVAALGRRGGGRDG